MLSKAECAFRRVVVLVSEPGTSHCIRGPCKRVLFARPGHVVKQHAMQDGSGTCLHKVQVAIRKNVQGKPPQYKLTCLASWNRWFDVKAEHGQNHRFGDFSALS